MQVNATPAAAHDVVNLLELAEVRAQHLPTAQVQLAPLPELRRRADEISRSHPRLREEAAFVVLDEAARRARFAASPLHPIR